MCCCFPYNMSGKQYHMNWKDEDMVSAMSAAGKKERADCI